MINSSQILWMEITVTVQFAFLDKRASLQGGTCFAFKRL